MLLLGSMTLIPGLSDLDPRNLHGGSHPLHGSNHGLPIWVEPLVSLSPRPALGIQQGAAVLAGVSAVAIDPRATSPYSRVHPDPKMPSTSHKDMLNNLDDKDDEEEIDMVTVEKWGSLSRGKAITTFTIIVYSKNTTLALGKYNPAS
ncbi:hypothetical protein GW7_12568 [Heterocephalus glaber]|uniref:Uncharacterized protein n=1 Tax=Heterocephalus glaber TaxID=10181 RepID=G5BP70_HETGA|nr:hypothetical protein GW7_12568 [Heterocephalus glaber]